MKILSNCVLTLNCTAGIHVLFEYYEIDSVKKFEQVHINLSDISEMAQKIKEREIVFPPDEAKFKFCLIGDNFSLKCDSISGVRELCLIGLSLHEIFFESGIPTCSNEEYQNAIMTCGDIWQV